MFRRKDTWIMEYPVSCICGITIHVPEGAGGTQARCSCGRSVAVPRLSELRELARRSPEFPELIIEDLLKEGRLPADSACLRCGEETDTIYSVLAECERARYGPPGCMVLPITWVTILFGTVVYRVTKPVWLEGRDVLLRLPLRLCTGCARWMCAAGAFKEVMRRVPVYKQLLQKYPAAKVSLEPK